MTAGPGWCDAPGVLERFRQLWDAGLSTADIGRHLGASKNAIIGKSRRLDFPPRPSPIRHSGRDWRKYLTDTEKAVVERSDSIMKEWESISSERCLIRKRAQQRARKAAKKL